SVLPSVPERLGAGGQVVHDLVDRARLHSLLERLQADAALAEREVVGEHANVLAKQLIESGILRARPRRHHSVLDEEEGDVTASFAQLSRKLVEPSDVSRFPRALRLNQHVLAHARTLLSVDKLLLSLPEANGNLLDGVGA